MSSDIVMNWDAMTEKEILIHIVGKIDNLVEKDVVHEKSLEDHEGRIRENEKWRWKTPAIGGGGAVALIGIAMALMKAAGWLG